MLPNFLQNFINNHKENIKLILIIASICYVILHIICVAVCVSHGMNVYTAHLLFLAITPCNVTTWVTTGSVLLAI